MKAILFLLIITLSPLSSIHSEALRKYQYVHIEVEQGSISCPIKRKNLKKKTRKQKNRQSKTSKKVQDRTPGFALMLVGGLILLTLAIFLIGTALNIVGGLAAALTFGAGFLLGCIASIVILIASIFLAKGIRENRTFNEVHGKTEKALKKELVATSHKKFPHLNAAEIRSYNRYQVKVHRLKALVALKKKKKFFSTKRIQRLQTYISDYQKRIDYLIEKNNGQERHELND